MLQESSAIFYRPKDKKMHADKARASFVRQGGDHFTLLNVWEQWSESNFSQTFCYEQFLQFKVLSRVRDIRDQLAGLCDRVEVVVQSNPNATDIIPIQKALTSGYFYSTVRFASFIGDWAKLNSFTITGTFAEERRLVPDSENTTDCVRPSFFKSLPAATPAKICSLLRACHDEQIVYAVSHRLLP